MREAARRRGIRLEWVRQADGPDAALREQKVDLWPLLTIIPERKSYVHFTEPYLENEHCFLVRADSIYEDIRDPVENTAMSRIMHSCLETPRKIPKGWSAGL